MTELRLKVIYYLFEMKYGFMFFHRDRPYFQNYPWCIESGLVLIIRFNIFYVLQMLIINLNCMIKGF